MLLKFYDKKLSCCRHTLPVGSWGQTRPTFLNPTCQFSDVFWTAVVSLTVVLCAVWFLHPPDSHAWMTARQNAKKTACLYSSSNIYTIREKKNKSFMLNIFTTIKLASPYDEFWGCLSLKWRSLNWVEDEQEHQHEVIWLQQTAMVLSKWKCFLCNKFQDT